MTPRSILLLPALGLATFALLGCTSAPLDAQWKSPQAATLAKPARLLVACDAAETVIARLCADEVQRAFAQRGVSVVPAASDTSAGPTPARDTALAAEARRVGAQAVWVATLRPDALDGEPRGGGVSIGIGGFSFGGRGGVGVGVSAPLDLGGRSPPRYAGDVRLVDPADGTLRWTARAGARASGEAQAQIGSIVERLVEGGVQAGVY